MKTLIAYSSKYGCTEKCVGTLAAKLSWEVDVVNLRGGKAVDLSGYDRVIIGGSIYMGRIQKQVTNLCEKNLDVLKGKKLGLFICCMAEGKEAEEELNRVFPEDLLKAAAAKEYFGGEFDFKKMNPMYRLIIKKVAKTDKDVSNVLTDNINVFAQIMNNA
ncbi:MAG: flavodoxin domain-containing protein [Firmicutes bacterium]|nr:flavodoxin domain-containing protein [Bacillota bacterium]MDD3851750.1 flavodoxin domain-containing protein [Bacillota bacterium]